MKKLMFFGEVRQYKRTDYARALRDYVESLKKEQGVASVYQIGQVTFPGLSDIDIVIALKGPDAMRGHSIKSLGTEARYIFMHEPYVIPASMAGKSMSLMAFKEPERLMGKSIKFERPSRVITMHTFIHEFLDGNLYRFERLINTRKVNMREISAQLNAMKYSFASFETISSSDKDFECSKKEYMADVQTLRKDFFRMSDKERQEMISMLIYRTRPLVNHMYTKTREFLKEKCKIRKVSNYYGYMPKIVLFTDTRDNREGRIFRRIAPEFSSVLREKDALSINDKDIRDGFTERISLVRDYEDSIFRGGLQSYMMLSRFHTNLGRFLD